MAQASSAQREPSMEEILASIRRIIEDSEAAQNDETNAAAGAPEPANEDAGAAVEVETFRSELNTEHVAFDRQAEGAGSGVSGAEGGRSPDSEMPGEGHGYDAVEAAAAELPTGPPGETAASAAGEDTLPEEGNGASEMPAGGHAGREAGGDASTYEPRASHFEPRPSAASGGDNPPAIISEVAGRKVAAAFEELNEAFEANRRKSFDQAAEEMLRPMLQEWLDNNLPTLVERLVREEIERVARGGSD